MALSELMISGMSTVELTGLLREFVAWREANGKGNQDNPGIEKLKALEGMRMYVGKVKTWDPERHRGFIMCEEVFYQYNGQDVYCHETVLQTCNAGLGDTVAFFVHISSTSGQPQASAPMVRLAAANAANGFALKGHFKKGTNDMAPSHGFLQCDVTHEFFGRDVYVHVNMAQHMVSGQAVAFNANVNKEMQPIMDLNCQIADESWEPPPGDLTRAGTDPAVEAQSQMLNMNRKGGKDKGKGKGKKMGKKMPMPPGDMMAPMMAPMPPGDMNPAGFIQNGAAFHAAMNPAMNPMIHQMMSQAGLKGYGKDLGMLNKGGPAVPAGTPIPPTPTGEVFLGVIKQLDPQNLYGFIASEQVQEKYQGGDVFFTRRPGEIESAAVGDIVEFDVGLNLKGQPEALSVRIYADPAAKRARLEALEAPVMPLFWPELQEP